MTQPSIAELDRELNEAILNGMALQAFEPIMPTTT